MCHLNNEEHMDETDELAASGLISRMCGVHQSSYRDPYKSSVQEDVQYGHVQKYI